MSSAADNLPLAVDEESVSDSSSQRRDLKARLSVLGGSGGVRAGIGHHSHRGYNALGEAIQQEALVEYHFPESPTVFDYATHPFRCVEHEHDKQSMKNFDVQPTRADLFNRSDHGSLEISGGSFAF